RAAASVARARSLAGGRYRVNSMSVNFPSQDGPIRGPLVPESPFSASTVRQAPPPAHSWKRGSGHLSLEGVDERKPPELAVRHGLQAGEGGLQRVEDERVARLARQGRIEDHDAAGGRVAIGDVIVELVHAPGERWTLPAQQLAERQAGVERDRAGQAILARPG